MEVAEAKAERIRITNEILAQNKAILEMNRRLLIQVSSTAIVIEGSSAINIDEILQGFRKADGEPIPPDAAPQPVTVDEVARAIFGSIDDGQNWFRLSQVACNNFRSQAEYLLDKFQITWRSKETER